VAGTAAFHRHRVRLCHLRTWDDALGYGFNMTAHRASSGHFVSDVDVGSPAEAARLRHGDRIVEVNGDNVETSSHQDVVHRIKSLADQVTLLVVDPEADRFFREQRITVVGSMDCVDTMSCPGTKPTAALVGR